MKDFRELKVWEKAHQLTLVVYQATTAFPKEELFGYNEPDAPVGSLNLNQHRRRLWSRQR